MSCVLRIGGKELDVTQLLRDVDIKPFRIWHRGESRVPGNPTGKICTDSGVSYSVGVAGMDDFEHQLEEATSFLTEHRVKLNKLSSYPGVEYVCVDFGIHLRPTYTHTDRLPSIFLHAAAVAGVSVELSHYPSDES